MCGVLVVRLLKREGGGAAYCPLCQDTGINEILRQVKFVIITPSLILMASHTPGADYYHIIS